MTQWEFEGPARRCRDEASADALPHPAGTVEITAQELEVLIAHHNTCAQACGARHQHDAETFHNARAAHLLRRLATLAPERVSPEKPG